MKYCILFILFYSYSLLANWPQGSGPNLDFQIDQSAPRAWSVSLNKGIAWRVPLPETGQSTPIIVDGKVFLTCFEPVSSDQKTGRDVLGLCFDAKTGKELWRTRLAGFFDSKLSGCFGDNSGPAAISDGKTVVFFNASGTIKSFDFEGNEIWSQNIMNSTRSDPFLWEGKILFCGSPNDLTKINGRHIKCLDYKTGKELWQSSNYSWDGLTPFPYQRPNGKWVALTARGGGHVKDTYDEGVSLIDLSNGKELWRYNYKGFMSTQNFKLAYDKAYIFAPKGKHLVLNLENGNLITSHDILSEQKADTFMQGNYTQLDIPKIDMNKRSVIQMSNLLFGDYHFFRTYNDNYLGRVNIKTGETKYLQLPTQIQRSGKEVLACWNEKGIVDEYPLKKKQKKHLANTWMIQRNKMENTQGYKVYGDQRSQFSGWGHHSTALPVVAENLLYIPSMSGLVYVVKWNSDSFDHHNLVSISDLGKLGDCWTRSSLSFSDGKIYARTIKELICIEGVTPEQIKPHY